jgi:hypothetical protein
VLVHADAALGIELDAHLGTGIEHLRGQAHLADAFEFRLQSRLPLGLLVQAADGLKHKLNSDFLTVGVGKQLTLST